MNIIYQITLTLWLVVILFNLANHIELIDTDTWTGRKEWIITTVFVLFAIFNLVSVIRWIWW